MHDVSVELFVKHRMDLESEETAHEYQGKGVEKENGWYISYKENMEGVGEVSTIVKIGQSDVSILRQGPLQMKQQFQQGKSNTSTYTSPHGPLAMETHTRRLRVNREQTQPMEVHIEYQLWLNQQYTGEHEIWLRLHWK